LRRRLCGE